MPTELSVNRRSKDSVFVKFFQDKNNILQFYKELHPEATDISVEDIDVQTLDSVIVNTIYNDLGFLVKDRYVLLVEAQSSWNPNIPLRMLFYLCETLRRYLEDTEQSEHYTKKVRIPTPELYVLYSGIGERPETVSLSEEFFGGTSNIELKVRVLNRIDETLSGQYIGFCKVFNDQSKLYDSGIEAAKETYKICIEKGYLTEFMKEHQKEVVDMMSELFDEAYLRKRYDAAAQKDQFEAGRCEGRREGELKGRREGELKGRREGKLEGKLEIVRQMLSENLPFDMISRYTKLPVEKIRELEENSDS